MKNTDLKSIIWHSIFLSKEKKEYYISKLPMMTETQKQDLAKLLLDFNEKFNNPFESLYKTRDKEKIMNFKNFRTLALKKVLKKSENNIQNRDEYFADTLLDNL